MESTCIYNKGQLAGVKGKSENADVDGEEIAEILPVTNNFSTLQTVQEPTKEVNPPKLKQI